MTSVITPAAIAHDCPDCLSETAIMHLGDNLHVVQILHDDTCPTYQQIEADHE